MINLSINGRLTRDPVFSQYTNRETGEISSVARFTVAVNMPRGGTRFVDCSAWNGMTKPCRYLKKGRMIFASGVPSAYHRQANGIIYDNLALSVSNLEFLDANPDRGAREPKPQETNPVLPEENWENIAPGESDDPYAFTEDNLPL